jgi:uncharacterized membrane protein YdbT with pleckstrin-like domain
MRLETKEKIIFKVHPHWFYVAVPESTLAIFGIFSFLFAYALLPKRIILILFVIAMLFAMLIIFLDWLCTNYYLTNLRLIEERGIIGKRIMFIPLNKVQDVACKFGILGKIFGFGDLEIESAGTYGKIVFSFIANPRKRKEEINKAILEFKANRKIMEGKEGK